MENNLEDKVRDVKQSAWEKIHEVKEDLKTKSHLKAPIPPFENSTNTDVDRLNKTTVQKFLKDDYLSDNAAHVDATFNCKRTRVSYNSQFVTSHKEGEKSLEFLDDIQLLTRWWGYQEKFKVKGGKVNWTLDLKTH